MTRYAYCAENTEDNIQKNTTVTQSIFNKYPIWYQHTMCHLVEKYGVMNER